MSLLTDKLGYNFALYRRKIRCPRHYLLKPGGQPFVMEKIPALKNIKEADAKIFKLKLWKRKHDKFGRPIQNFKDYYQPEISAGWAYENIYKRTPHDPNLKEHQICMQCKRCITK